MKRFLAFCGILTLIVLFGFASPVTVYADEPTMVRVGLRRSFAGRDSIAVSNTIIMAGYGTDAGFMPVRELQSVGGFTARVDGGRVVLVSGGQVVYTFDASGRAQIIAICGEFVTMGGYSFRGAVEFIPSGGRIDAVNVLSLEEYLYGVMPAEMSPSFHPEALKAQAVAARTFAFNQIRGGRHRAQGFDICDTTCCQVYRGAGHEHANTTAAVRATHGLMLLHNGQTILAQFFSSSGGATDNSEDVWWEALPYLRSVNEIAEHEPMVWTRTFTWAQLTTAAANRNANVGTVNGVSVSRIGASGNALELTIHGTNGNWTTSREDIRSFFTPIGGSLPSRNFRIEGASPTTPQVSVTSGWQDVQAPLNHLQALDNRGAISTVHFGYIFDGQTTRRIETTPAVARGGSGITLEGRGWGHAVGMSQRGAEGMARLGFTFLEILTHYYTGVEIRVHG